MLEIILTGIVLILVVVLSTYFASIVIKNQFNVSTSNDLLVVYSIYYKNKDEDSWNNWPGDYDTLEGGNEMLNKFKQDYPKYDFILVAELIEAE